MVRRYRRLRASSKARSAEFGTQFEKLLSAARAGTITDFVTKLVRLAPGCSALLSNQYYAEEYEIEIVFRKPSPGHHLCNSAPRRGAR